MELTDLSWAGIRDAIRFFFSLIFFPAVTIGVILYVLVTVVGQIRAAKDHVRRLTAALLPVVGLIFAIVSTDYSREEVALAMSFIGPGAQLLLGAALGALAVFFRRLLSDSRYEIGPTLFVLFVSTGGSFLLFVVIMGALASLNYYLFGCVLGGAAYVIGRGWIWPEKSRRKHTASGPTERDTALPPDHIPERELPRVRPPSI